MEKRNVVEKLRTSDPQIKAAEAGDEIDAAAAEMKAEQEGAPANA